MKTTKLITLLLFGFIILSCSDKKKENLEETKEVTREVVEIIPTEESLFHRLGGDEGINSIVDDIVQAHLDNPIISDVFTPLQNDPTHFESFKTHVKEFLSAGTGGGAIYTGKDMPSAHAGLNINEKQFIAAVDDILLVLNNHNIDDETKKDMLFILYSLKGVVIGL